MANVSCAKMSDFGWCKYSFALAYNFFFVALQFIRFLLYNIQRINTALGLEMTTAWFVSAHNTQRKYLGHCKVTSSRTDINSGSVTNK